MEKPLLNSHSISLSTILLEFTTSTILHKRLWTTNSANISVQSHHSTTSIQRICDFNSKEGGNVVNVHVLSLLVIPFSPRLNHIYHLPYLSILDSFLIHPTLFTWFHVPVHFYISIHFSAHFSILVNLPSFFILLIKAVQILRMLSQNQHSVYPLVYFNLSSPYSDCVHYNISNIFSLEFPHIMFRAWSVFT